MSVLQRLVTLRASAAQAAAGTATGDGVTLDQKFTEMVVTLNVTAAATDVADTLDVYVDTSFDGGTTFVNIGHFTQVLGNGGAKKFVMSFKANPIAASNSVSATGDQSAGNALQIGFGNVLRYRGVMVDGDANGSFTYEVKAFLK